MLWTIKIIGGDYLMVSTGSIVGAIFGAILIFYLIANTFNDASDQVQAINESHKGGTLMKLLPLLLAFGVLIGVYGMFKTGKKM